MPHFGELLELERQMLNMANVAQSATPASGSTVQMINNALNGFLRIRGSGPIALLAIAHPNNGASIDGQIRSVFFEVDVGAITWPNSPTGQNLPSSAAAGDSCTTQRLEPSKWSRRF